MALSPQNITGSPLSTVVGLGAGGAIIAAPLPPTGNSTLDAVIFWLQMAVGLATAVLGALRGVKQ